MTEIIPGLLRLANIFAFSIPLMKRLAIPNLPWASLLPLDWRIELWVMFVGLRRWVERTIGRTDRGYRFILKN